MTRKWGDTGLAVMGSRHVLTITYPDPDEMLLETPEELPTSEPETPQVEFTIGAAHLPNLQGASAAWTPMLYAAGQNTSGGTLTISYRILKNGVSIQTGTRSTSNNYYWSVTAYNYFDAQVGDTIQLSAWTTASGADWRYKALAVLPTRIDIAPASQRILYLVTYTLVAYPTLTLGGNPSVIALSTGSWHIAQGLLSHSAGSSGDVSFSVLGRDETYRGGSTEYGDSSRSSSSTAHSSNIPFYRRQLVPTQIVYYPLAVR